MTYKTTMKTVKSGYCNIYSIGYCGAYHLLRLKEPVAYTSGIDGHNADIYDIGGGNAIATGYRPFGKKVNYDMLRKYDNRARELSTGIPWDEYQIYLTEIYDEFIQELTNGNK